MSTATTLTLQADAGELLAMMSELADAARQSDQLCLFLGDLLGQDPEGSALHGERLMTGRAPISPSAAFPGTNANPRRAAVCPAPTGRGYFFG